MPFVRFSRDKRGYEQIALVQPTTRRGKPSKPRVLYFYRSPSGVKIGREAFDEAIRHALEAQNPDVNFDWKQLAASAVPPPDFEPWRERRQIERAAKQRRLAEEREEEPENSEAETLPEPVEETVESAEPSQDLSAASAPEPVTAPAAASEVRRRRRRRGGRRRGRRPAETPSEPSKE